MIHFMYHMQLRAKGTCVLEQLGKTFFAEIIYDIHNVYIVHFIHHTMHIVQCAMYVKRDRFGKSSVNFTCHTTCFFRRICVMDFQVHGRCLPNRSHPSLDCYFELNDVRLHNE